MSSIMKKNRVGETGESKNCGHMTITEYRGANDIDATFTATGGVVKTTVCNFQKGGVKDPLLRTVFGVGFVGMGKYKTKVNNKTTKQYETWKNILSRCFVRYGSSNCPTYSDATVCDEWLNYQTFSDFYESNHYKIPDQRVHIDKDIIKKGNKEYSPEFCCFVPISINSIFTKSDVTRGKYLIGVTKQYRNYVSTISIDGKNKSLGNFNTEIEAFEAYKMAKEAHIKVMADRYKEYLPSRVYEALYNYQVNIID